MGLLLLFSAVGGLVVGLTVASLVLALFALVKGVFRRGNSVAFVLLAALGAVLAFVATTLANLLLAASTNGLPHDDLWFLGAFAIGCSPAGTALGLLALLLDPDPSQRKGTPGTPGPGPGLVPAADQEASSRSIVRSARG